MTRIAGVHAREVFDSRGKPTVEVEVTCAGARPGRAIVPSGASTGRFEAVELRDGDRRRLDGTGVRQAVEHVRGEIARAVTGMDAADQRAVDRRLCELDGTENKSHLGANAILGVSLATAYAAAEAKGVKPVEHFREVWATLPAGGMGSHALNVASRGHPEGTRPPDKSVGSQRPLAGQGVPSEPIQSRSATQLLGNMPLLPLPMVNLISGGLHAGGNLDFQDFLMLPVGARSYREALDWVVTVYRRLGRLLAKAGYEGHLVGDEGGYGPRLRSNSEAVELILAAIESAGLRPGDDVALGLDVASSHFFRDGTYTLTATGENPLTAGQLVDLLEEWVESYPILSIEDGLAEDDWPGWRRLTERLGERVQLIGDDLFVTNSRRLERGIERGAANSVLVKLNQIGTLWETLETLRMALHHGYWPVISARSGETEDAAIADLAVATGAGQIKIGSVARSERLAKYNQLLRLEEELGSEAGYLGGSIFSRLKRGSGEAG